MKFDAKPVALASFPGSGNTWTRYLLQQATGIWTGSIYHDKALTEHVFLSKDIHDSSVLFVKTHRYKKEDMKIYSKAVLIVRDPKDAILAEFNRQKGGRVGHASLDKFAGKGHFRKFYSKNSDEILIFFSDWNGFVSKRIHLWNQTNFGWKDNFEGPVCILYYDDLKENIEKSLRKVLNFAGFPINETLLKCAVDRKNGIPKRKKMESKFDPFTAEMKEMINKQKLLVFTELNRS